MNISGAVKHLTGETMSETVETQATVEVSGCGRGGTPETTEAVLKAQKTTEPSEVMACGCHP
ncbi:MAG UNVERIFIED_CONTAM: hypothetical protein LVR29_00895 [Microcystis novacekii LVE1205-3]